MSEGTPMLRAAAACAAVGLALTGCGDGQEPVEEHVGPLDAYLDEIGGGWDEDAMLTRVEELTAACMTEAGFEYFPLTEFATGVVPAGLGTLEFAKEFGYGYTFESEGPGTGTFYWGLPPDQSPAALANRAYVESLSDAAKREYDVAMMGDLADLIEDPETFDWESADHGCRGRAGDQVNEANAMPEFPEALDAVNAVWQLVEEDPRVTEAVREWSGCMSDAGYPGLTAIFDAENLVNDLVNDFMRANFRGMNPDYEAVKADAPTELAALQDKEIAVAVADATCREESGYTVTHREVSDEYQQAVVDQYRTELDAWVAAAQAARG